MSARAISVEYALNPPASSAQASELPTSKKHAFALPAGSGSGYYTTLRAAIEQARNEVGQELTAWRDAVGKAELSKEAKKTRTDDDEEEEEEEDV
ncbi:hypothetical protein C8J57DRAFT_27138 [Mycena rebaudengoi]|nr:hypothetical protein C8J57DRAFT_27138 [Mycena rebaudengoi]